MKTGPQLAMLLQTYDQFAGPTALSKITNIYDVDLKLLRYFCTVVEEGGFTAAQTALNLSQSMLSDSVRSLEIRLGTRLCQRGAKGFKLLPEGEIVYAAAKDLFGSVEAFKEGISEVSRKAIYELVVGVQESALENPASRVPQALREFSASYPNVRFRLEIMLDSQLVGHVADGFVHVGIGLATGQFPQLTYTPLYQQRVISCCAQGHALFDVPEEELTMEMINAASFCTNGRVEYLRAADQDNSARGDIGRGARALLTLIMSGRNVGRVPDYLAEPYLRSGVLRPLLPEATTHVHSIAAITGPPVRGIELANSFVDALVNAHADSGSRQTDYLSLATQASSPGSVGRLM